jgi:phosphoserine phosphatase
LSDYVFLFDLDATITKAEILPEIAVKINKEKQMRELTEKTMAV